MSEAPVVQGSCHCGAATRRAPTPIRSTWTGGPSTWDLVHTSELVDFDGRAWGAQVRRIRRGPTTVTGSSTPHAHAPR